MAESRRKLDSKKWRQEEEEDEESHKVRNWILLGVIVVAMVAIVAGMFYLSGFLSNK